MSLPHTLLGFLSTGPAHGYDLKRAHDAHFPSARPLAYAQVYSTLGRLQRDDLVEVAETTQDGGPERTVYALTAKGEEVLREWLATVEPAGPYPAESLVRKTVTALELGADALDFLARQRTAHLDMMRDLVSLQRETREAGARISIDHSIFHLDADLRWLEAASARIVSTGARR